MSQLYVDQLVKVRVILDSVDIHDDYEKKLKQKVMKTYGDRFYLNGFIDKKTIEIVRIEMGRRIGAHLHGFSTFNIEFTARFCVPKRGTLITCRVQKVNKFGVEANEYPMNIIVPKQLHYQYYTQQGDKTPMEKFDGLEEGKMIRVMAMSYGLKDGNLVVVGVIDEILKETAQSLTLTPSLLSIEYQVNLSFVPEKPAPPPELGILRALYPRIKETGKKWIEVKKALDNYAFVDVVKLGPLIYSPQAIYPPASRTYFKLREIFSETKFLDIWRDQTLQITIYDRQTIPVVVQSLIDYRNHQHQDIWVKDTYHISEPLQDRKYADLLNEQGYQVSDASDAVPKSHLIIINDETVDQDDEYDYAKEVFAKIIMAMSVQSDGGILVVKVFSIYYEITIQILQLLSVYYDSLRLIKPVVSHPMDNEKYLICSNFLGITSDKLEILRNVVAQWQQHHLMTMLDLVEKPNSGFRSDLATFNQVLLDTQVKKINLGFLYLQQDMKHSEDQRAMTERWCHKYGIPLKPI
jgi:DNA-directed RNA polymerase subunit E'/Rpb7/23S rRNA U2552 (ribose-2'-O)-methylase RlmE/FtsJ